MPEPLTTAGATAVLGGTALVGFWSGLDAEVVLGAFAGTVIFVTSAVEFPIKRRLILSLVSFIIGIITYRPVAAFIIDFLPTGYDRGADAAGALLSAVIAVRLLMAFYGRAGNPGAIFKRGGDDEQS
ncbi:hypothetical protein HB991_13625 [Yersinia mollaretii]|uniref:Phage holin n=1 Tax=Yersinia mollaretii TaxID=33060 RepID=A0AA44CMT1_YERMO|nr:putative holin [Yersinia mollaretii]NIL23544.1 hypothetical protein [Yersinia mollaretii]